jgi:hypothetical protein
MIGRGLTSSKRVLGALAAAGAVVAVLAGPARAATKPVPSLTPKATHQLWLRLVHRPHRPLAAADCKPARVVVYTETDWLRVATKLAANASPCAQYVITIPPLAANKTQPRVNQAGAIRALGPAFVPFAEVNYAGWSAYVRSTSVSWFDAGVEARRRVDAAGYSGWAVNEMNSAVRQGAGTARQDAADFLRGLYTGDSGVPRQGVVFTVGIAENTSNLATYKTNLQGWLGDSGFWTAIPTYVSDWLQETYGDMRAYAVADSTAQQRRDALVRYLGAVRTLANAGPDEAAPARAFLQQAYGPLTTASWASGGEYGFTQFPFQQMEDYVSAETYAARFLASGAAQTVDRFGYAWAPLNTLGLSASDFASQTGEILNRIAAAVHDSAETVDPLDPGVGACGAAGQPVWCSTVVPGAAFTTAWTTFSTWAPPRLVITSPPMTLTAGVWGGPLTVELQTNGLPNPNLGPQTVTLSTSSPKGAFATDPAGPWSGTLALTIPLGSDSAAFYYLDTEAGAPTISASLPAQPPAQQTVNVLPGALASIVLAPKAATLTALRTKAFAGAGRDSFGNSVSTPIRWSLGPGTPGRLTAVTGRQTTFAAAARVGTGTVVARGGAVTASARVTVKKGTARVVSIRYTSSAGRLVVTTTVRDAGKLPVPNAALTLRVERGGRSFTLVRGKTTRSGTFVWRSTHRAPAGCYSTRVERLVAPGFTWNGRRPSNGTCRR